MANGNFRQLAEQVVALVGGKDNVQKVIHCQTRLRFNLKDNGLAKIDELKKTSGVLGVVQSGVQLQVVIGPTVSQVYDEVCTLVGLEGETPLDENLDAAPKQRWTPKRVGSAILDALSGCLGPVIPVITACAFFKMLTSLLGPDMLNVLPAESDLYTLFTFVGDAGFYFFPVIVGYSAAKKFNLLPVLGILMGCILMHPTFVGMADSGESFTVYGIPCDTTTNYAQTVLPVMLSVYFLSLVYKAIKKVMPDMLTTVFTPFLSVLISTPFILCLLAPLGTIVGNGISGGLAWFGNATGFFGVAIIAALWEFLVLTGMHLALMMPMMASFFETGVGSGPMISGSFATWACFGVALGAALRLREKSEKGAAFAAFISGLVGGITEPTLYGICFRYTRCFAAMALGGFVGGAYAGITNVCNYAITTSNFLSVLSFSGGSGANLLNGIIGAMLSLVVAAVATYLFGFGKTEKKN